MNAQAQRIINDQSLTKTDRMIKLFELGYSRPKVVNMTGWGRGFVQNVYAAKYGTGRSRRRAIERVRRYEPSAFDDSIKFGVEIEFYGPNKRQIKEALESEGITCSIEGYHHNTRGHWKIMTDGSINAGRGEATEVVSPILKGRNGLDQLRKVCASLTRCRALVNKSCGLHVHFDASTFDLNTWKRIYKNYARYETVIDSMMPRSRRGNRNRYCRSITDRIGRDLPTAYRKIDNARTLKALSNAISNRNRYCKINAESYFRHQSIEFRQHSGTREYDKMENWIMFIHHLIDYSKQGFVADQDSFDSLTAFVPAEVHDFYHNRIMDLAA